MLSLHDRLDQESLPFPVIAVDCQDFANDSATWLTVDMDHEVDRLTDLGFGVGKCGLRMAAHYQIG